MVRPKARFKGDGAGTMLLPFSEKLRTELRGFDPRHHSREDIEQYRAFMGDPDPTTDSGSPHPSEEFADAVLSVARSAVAHRHWQQFEVKKPELRAEIEAIRQELVDASNHLRSLSTTLARLLDIEADPIELASDLDKMVAHIEKVAGKVDDVPSAKKQAETDHMVALTLVREVLPLLQEYGMKVGATVEEASGKHSTLIQVLKAIGDDFGLRLAPHTWRNIVQNFQRTRKPERGTDPSE